MPARTILHLDLDAFFCCVEELLNPSLRGKAFAVGGAASGRGVVASCSYTARAFGVRSAMPMAQAMRLIPKLIVVSVKFGSYREYSQKVMSIIGTLTPMIEQVSIDEAFLDMTGLPGEPRAIAQQLQALILEQTHLPCSIGVASNKLVAKIANNRGKATQMNGHTPAAIEVVPPGDEQAYLAPLRISELWGIGAKTETRLQNLGIHTIGDITRQSLPLMQQRFGKHGAEIWQRAHGRDNRSVETDHETRSVSGETTFSRDVTQLPVLHATLHELSQTVARRLRAKDLQGTTIRLKLRLDDFTTLTRQIAIPTQTSDETIISTQAIRLLSQVWDRHQPVRLIGVGVSSLRGMEQQLSLFDTPDKSRSPRIIRLMDQLQQQYGEAALRRARDIQKPPS